MRVLDATLRDGGLKVGFSWSENFAEAYIAAMRIIPQVEWIEVGYLNAGKKFESSFYGLDDHFLDKICSGSSTKIAAMVDFHYRPMSLSRGQCAGFPELIRVTSRRGDLGEAVPYARSLVSETGSSVSLNLSNASNYSEEDWNYLFRLDLRGLDYVYIADTHGSLKLQHAPCDFSALVARIREQGAVPGIHLHDHLGNASRNFSIASTLGFEIFDGTLAGLGKGGGNLALEQMLDLGELLNLLPLLYGEVKDRGFRQQVAYLVTAHFSVADHYGDQFLQFEENLQSFISFCYELSGPHRDEFDSSRLIDFLSKTPPAVIA